MKKTENDKEGTQQSAPKNAGINKHPEIKMDYPLSEKDEVKQAEEKMRMAAKL